MLKGIAKLLSGGSSVDIDGLVRQVIEASLDSVCKRVVGRVDDMTLSEARGYVRARAAEIVHRQSRLAISNNSGSNPAWSSTIARTATERMIPLVVRQLRVGVPCGTGSRQAA